MRRPLLTSSLWVLAGFFLLAYRFVFSFDRKALTTILLAAADLACLACCAWAMNRLFIPRLLHGRKFLLFAGSLLVTAVPAVYLLQALQYLTYRFSTTVPALAWRAMRLPTFQFFNTWLVIVVGLAAIVSSRMLGDYLAAGRRYRALQQEQAQTELLFLKAQINPHFLFNSINSIYAHIDKANSTARTLVLQFSQMLRYQLYECNTERIPIEKELAYLVNYLDLQRLRLNDNVFVELERGEGLRDFSIAPLLLIPFIENAFKYVSAHEHRPNLIRTSLQHANGRLSFRCFNTKDGADGHALPEMGGIGIGNVRRRLELLYPNRYALSIENTPDSFEVALTLDV